MRAAPACPRAQGATGGAVIAQVKVRLGLGMPKGATCGTCLHFLRTHGSDVGHCYRQPGPAKDAPDPGASRGRDEMACAAWEGGEDE